MSSNSAEKLCLQDEFALLVLLTSLICLIIFPTHSLFALSTVDVAYYVAPSGHVTLVGLRLGNVDNAIEQIRFAMLATEVSTENVVVVGEMRLAVLAAINARRVEVDVVRESHSDG